MAETAETAFTNHVSYGALIDSLSDFFIWNETPFNAQNLSEARGVRGVKLSLLAGFQMLGFAVLTGHKKS